ncbi:alanine racemase [Thermoplasma sp.]|uniref:alanine racemase n=1 Tax=Thermoplasma sp. TaxID=1973142 RepID=UPI002632DE41|nr:alanine racemase [Thermoplasma sp.]
MDYVKALDLPFDTPFMVIDIEQTRKNIRKMQDVADRNGKRLRPHSKTHKIPELSKMEIEAGAVGVCVQKTAEAEIMFYGGVKNILLSNEIFGSKFLRVGKLVSMGCDLTVAVDNIPALDQFSEVCRQLGIYGNVLIDVNIGMNRCGIDPEKIDSLIEGIKSRGNLNLAGIMAYDGHVNDPDVKKREEEVRAEELIIEPIIRKIKSYCSDDPVVSVGGTPTAEIWAKSSLATELQPGTYVYYDVHCMRQNLCTMEEISMGVVSMCTSESRGDRIVLDAGYKSVAIDQGVYPTVMDADGNEYKVLSMSEEHTVLKAKDNSSHLGQRFLLLPYHACTTTDLWDSAYVFDGNGQPYSLPIRGRGKRE